MSISATLSSEDICLILITARECNVESFRLGELEIRFTQETQHSGNPKMDNHLTILEQNVNNSTRNVPSAAPDNESEVMELDEESRMDMLMLSDPLAYEDQVSTQP